MPAFMPKIAPDSSESDALHVISDLLPDGLLTSSLDCVKVLNTDGQLMWMSDHGQRLMEICDVDPLIGTSWIDLWPKPYKEAAAEAVRAAAHNEARRFTGACPTAKGTWKWWDVAVTPLRDRTDRVNCVLAVSRDVTDYVDVCRERDDLIERERSLRLELEKANRTRDYALLASAHELGAPLFAVRGWAQFLQIGTPRPTDWVDGLDAIERNTRRLHEVVEQILEVARFRSTQVSLNRVANSISEVIVAAIQGVEPAAHARQIAISADVPSGGWVRADFQQLQCAFSNILFNAVKFTPQGGAIRVRCTVDHNSVVSDITDTGVGIPCECIGDIFEPFSQCSPADASPSSGMGLGLSIARRIVEAHEGTIRAASPGRGLGSTFTIALPLYSKK